MNDFEDPVWTYAVTQAESEGVRWGQLPVRVQENRLTQAKAAMEALRLRGTGVAEWLLDNNGEKP